jgi:hypothetical protein
MGESVDDGTIVAMVWNSGIDSFRESVATDDVSDSDLDFGVSRLEGE